jgi:hypothetical protein
VCMCVCGRARAPRLRRDSDTLDGCSACNIPKSPPFYVPCTFLEAVEVPFDSGVAHLPSGFVGGSCHDLGVTK